MANKKPHAIMLPFPLQGHITPSINLALKLASHGFTITFVNTEVIHHNMMSSSKKTQSEIAGHDIFIDARESGLDIRYETVSDGFSMEYNRGLNLDHYLETFPGAFLSNIDELVREIIGTADSPVTCLIGDTFHVALSTVANKYNLVHISFWTEPALVLTLYLHLDLLRINGHFPSNRKDTIDYIPGIQAIEPRDLMSHIQDKELSIVNRNIFKAFEDTKWADFIVCNTVQELENEAISALHLKQPTYAFGPIFPSGFTDNTVSTNLMSESDCTQWLDTKPDGSVLYVSFGSLATSCKSVIMEIANGLSLSRVNFLWAIRPNIISFTENDFQPVGFAEDVGERGLIVPWCHQKAVISHPSIGGFLTHCGWNSLLESIWCGVPLLCFPLMSDQFTNRKLVVDDWSIGINLCDDQISITKEEVAEKVNRLMSEKSSYELRKEMKNVQKTVHNALSINGSSERNFNQFIMDLNVKIHEKCGLITKITK